MMKKVITVGELFPSNVCAIDSCMMFQTGCLLPLSSPEKERLKISQSQIESHVNITEGYIS